MSTTHKSSPRSSKETKPAAAPAVVRTDSGIVIEPVYNPVPFDYESRLGSPGEYPFTRGIYPTMYRGRLWTMRQYAGFGSAREANQRYRYLLGHGTTGLSVAFDLPTQMGYDSDHPMADGEVGNVGVAIDSLEDMEALFEGIRLDAITTSMTINSTAAPCCACTWPSRRNRAPTSQSFRARFRTTSLKSISRGAPTSIRLCPRCGSLPTFSPGAGTIFQSGTRSRSAAITSGRRARRRFRSWRSPSPTP